MDAAEAVAPYRQWLDRDWQAVIRDLEAFVALLHRWQAAQNLVSRETLANVWERHIADSLQVLKLLQPSDQVILDLGSGGGLPAIPLAIARPTTRFVLVEPNQRKASFLRTAARELGLRADIRAERADQIDSRETIRPDVITSRALASLTALCGMSELFWVAKTRAIFHKGREYGAELAESRAVWHHDVVIVPSDTNPEGALLELRHLRLKSVR